MKIKSDGRVNVAKWEALRGILMGRMEADVSDEELKPNRIHELISCPLRDAWEVFHKFTQTSCVRVVFLQGSLHFSTENIMFVL
jgi:hypothetical protein